MVKEKLTMCKKDVQAAIGRYVLKNYQNLVVKSRQRLMNISKVLATIQDVEYYGIGKYNVLFDIYGSETDEYGGIKENIHYTALCSVSVDSDQEGSPIVKLNDSLFLTKQIY